MRLAAQTSGASLVFLGLLMVIVVYLLLRSHRYFSQRSQSWSPGRPVTPAKPPKPSSASSTLGGSGWEVEMHDSAQQWIAQLDSKMGALEHLIREADRAAARLEAALAAVERTPTPGDVASAAALAGDSTVWPPRPAPPKHQAEGLEAAGAGDAPADRLKERSTEPAAHPAADRRYDEIYLLADYGFDPAEIARRVQLPIGEVQLILNLRAKRR